MLNLIKLFELEKFHDGNILSIILNFLANFILNIFIEFLVKEKVCNPHLFKMFLQTFLGF